MTRWQKWIAALAACLLALVATVYFFDWNLARPYLARKVLEATGRNLIIAGDLEVHLSMRPRIVANDLTLSNAAWSKEPLMAKVKRAEFRIDLLALFSHRFSLSELSLSDGRLVLERNQDGAPNWIFDLHEKQWEIAPIDALAMDRGSLHFRDPALRTDLEFDVNTIDAGKDALNAGLALTGNGQFKGMPTVLQAQGGSLLALRGADQPYPIRVTATLGTTKVKADGVLIDPLHLRGEEVNFQLEGSDLALLYPIVGVPIPPTPAYKLKGFLSHTNDVWKFSRFTGVVGNSDLAGEFSVDRGKKPQMIAAALVSRNLELHDLGGFIGGKRGATPGDHPPPSDKVLPTEVFSLEKLRAADVDVRFQGARVITQIIPFENMDAHMLVKDGALKLSPLNFGIAGGNLVTEIAMDARNSHIVTHADITARGLHLDQLFPASKRAVAGAGTMGGRAKLVGNGNSVAQLLGTANGEAALIMDGGAVSELLLRLSNLDVANALVVLVGGDKQVPIHCMVANFKAIDGDFQVKEMLLDTPKVNIVGEGNVNFTDESLHLRLVAHAKGFSLASFRGPIAISGPFKNPAVHPELGKAAVRGGLALALGAVTAGVGALIPLLEFGKAQESHCTTLLSQAKADTGIKQSDVAPAAKARR